MKNRIFGKGLVFGIIVLFLSASIIPIAGSLSVEKSSSIIRPLDGSRDYNITLNGTMGNNGWYVSCVYIGISGCGGCEAVLFKIDDGAWFTYTGGPVGVCRDGLHCVEAIVVDQYGNQTHLGPVFFRIDMTPPTVVLHKGGSKNKIIILTVEAWDHQSGFTGVIEFYVDGKFAGAIITPPYEWMLSLPRGKHIVTAKAYDFAGNCGSDSVSTSFSLSQSNNQPSNQQNSQSNSQRNSLLRILEGKKFQQTIIKIKL